MSENTDFETDSDVATEHEFDEVPLFHVVMYNDDFTTMDFVVFVLVEVFAYDMERAVSVMMSVHHEGKAVVATLPKEIGEMKIAKVQDYAEQAEYPLLLTLERA